MFTVRRSPEVVLVLGVLKGWFCVESVPSSAALSVVSPSVALTELPAIVPAAGLPVTLTSKLPSIGTAPTSAASKLNLRINGHQFTPSILYFHLPINASLSVVDVS